MRSRILLYDGGKGVESGVTLFWCYGWQALLFAMSGLEKGIGLAEEYTNTRIMQLPYSMFKPR